MMPAQEESKNQGQYTYLPYVNQIFSLNLRFLKRRETKEGSLIQLIFKKKVKLIGHFVVIRLVNGGSISEGRVEVFYTGTWGTVCDDSWDLNDAKVICHQLGFGGARKAYTSAAFGPGNGKIWMDDVNCTGNERSLTECSHNGWGIENCDHSEDAGVLCSSNRDFIF